MRKSVLQSKKHRAGRALSCALALALLLSLLPMGAMAADGAGSGTTGSETAAGETAGSLPESAVTFTFSDSGITAAGEESGYKIEGTALTVNESGTYTITGSCAEGSVKVKKGTTGVTLILRDLELTSSETAPLCCNKETEVTVYLAGTVKLTDAEDPANEDSADETVAPLRGRQSR